METPPRTDAPSARAYPRFCPACEYERQATDITLASECPKCGILFDKLGTGTLSARKQRRALPTVPHSDPKPAGKKLSFGDWFGRIFLWSFSLLLVATLWESWFGPPSSDRAATNDSLTAFSGCESYITAALKAPSSAKFGSIVDSSVVSEGAGAWAVSGYVDAQNSFGANLRSRYTCRVNVSGSRTTLTGLTIN